MSADPVERGAELVCNKKISRASMLHCKGELESCLLTAGECVEWTRPEFGFCESSVRECCESVFECACE